MELTIRHRPSTARGWPIGQTHHRARHRDATVARARALVAEGMSCADAAALLGVPRPTVANWVAGRRRTGAPVRLIVSRDALRGALKPPTDSD